MTTNPMAWDGSVNPKVGTWSSAGASVWVVIGKLLCSVWNRTGAWETSDG